MMLESCMIDCTTPLAAGVRWQVGGDLIWVTGAEGWRPGCL